jgi:hypothetical protein
LEELKTVLSTEEQNLIMMSIVTEDWSLMPPGFAPPVPAARTSKPKLFVCQVPYAELFCKKQTPFLNKFCIMVKQTVTLLGLKLKCNLNQHIISTFELKKGIGRDGVIMWKGSSNSDKVANNGEEYYKISPTCSLDADVEYFLTIALPQAGRYDAYTIQPFRVKTLKSNELTVELFGYEDFCILEAFLFEV